MEFGIRENKNVTEISRSAYKELADFANKLKFFSNSLLYLCTVCASIYVSERNEQVREAINAGINKILNQKEKYIYIYIERRYSYVKIC